MRSNACRWFLAYALALGVSQGAFAQAFGARSLGNGIGSPTGAGAFSNNSTTGAFNNNNSSLSQMGGGGIGTSGLGMSPAGGGNSGLLGQAGQLGQNSYARGRAGQFVGADRNDAGAANPFSQAGAMGMGGANQFASAAMFSQLQQRMRQQQQTLNQGQRGGQNGRSQLRIPMRLPPAERGVSGMGAVATAQLSRRLTKLPALTTRGPIEVLTQGQTVILRGQVATDSDRVLAEEIALLEPGVSVVRNELSVGLAGTRVGESRPSPSAREF